MQLQVIYREDDQGEPYDRNFTLTKPAFIKHAAIAGMKYAPALYKLHRIIGIFFLYKDYMRDFSNNRFSEPFISDPTEKGQFSNLVGKAIADFLSKRISSSRFTVNYESAMKAEGMPISGSRPDLLAFGSNSVFAIEAKGLSKFAVSDDNMNVYKRQSRSGPIPVDFAVASVAYNLYSSIQCKYYDPPNDHNSKQDKKKLLIKLSQKYYSGLAGFLNKKYFNIKKKSYGGEFFYELTPKNEFLHSIGICSPLCKECSLWKWSLILPKIIDRLAKDGISPTVPQFKFIEKENLYIDIDGVGIKLIK